MKVKHAAFVGYPVRDMKAARDFYENLLGLRVGELDQELESMPGKYWVEYELGNVTLAISNTWEPAAAGGPSIALEVEDLEKAVAELKAAGVTIVAEHLGSAYCDFALITDPDGNGITLHKQKAETSGGPAFAARRVSVVPPSPTEGSQRDNKTSIAQRRQVLKKRQSKVKTVLDFGRFAKCI